MASREDTFLLVINTRCMKRAGCHRLDGEGQDGRSSLHHFEPMRSDIPAHRVQQSERLEKLWLPEGRTSFRTNLGTACLHISYSMRKLDLCSRVHSTNKCLSSCSGSGPGDTSASSAGKGTFLPKATLQWGKQTGKCLNYIAEGSGMSGLVVMAAVL